MNQRFQLLARLRTSRLTGRVLAFVLLIGVSIGSLTGCANPPRMIPTPQLFQDADVDTFFAGAGPRIGREDIDPATYDVFLASDRRINGGDNPTEFFTNDRAIALTLATARMRIGEPGEPWADLQAESIKVDGENGPRVYFESLHVHGTLDASRPDPAFAIDPTFTGEGEEAAALTNLSGDEGFADDLRQQLGAEGELFIYVHGYNTHLDHNLALMTSIRHYMNRRGPVLLYEWPSAGKLLGYLADKNAAELTVRNFRELLLYLSSIPEIKRIHILAHSAGSPVVVNALRDIRLRYERGTRVFFRTRLKIGRVLLAAPDMDLMRFIQAGRDGFADVADTLCIYLSSSDNALLFSSRLFGEPRLGFGLLQLESDQRRALLGAAHVDAVDAGRAQAEFPKWLGHRYFRENPWAASDMLLYFYTGLPPTERGLVESDQDLIYEFPDDYPERLRELQMSLQP